MNARRWSQVMLLSLSLTALAIGPRARAQEAVGLAAKPASARPARPLLWSVPPERQIRLLIDSDAACESDDQAVIAHALLSSSFVIRGLVAAHFRGVGPSSGRSTAETMQASYEEMLALLRVMRLEGCFPVRPGAAKPFADPAVPMVGQQGELGRFLYGRVVRFVAGFKWINEFFQYADEAAVGVLLQQPMWNGDFEMRPAPSIAPNGTYMHNGKNRPIRVYRSYDHRAGLEDLFAKLKAFAKGELRPSCGDKPTPQK